MVASLSMRVCTGTAAGTESVAQTGFALMKIDSAANAPGANPVLPGTNSFEKWLRLAIDNSDGRTISGFWLTRSGALPDGAIVKIGIAGAGVTPTAALSVVATETMHSGRRYFFDAAEYDTNGDRTAFVVLQGQLGATAPLGAIDQQTFQWGWSAS